MVRSVRSSNAGKRCELRRMRIAVCVGGAVRRMMIEMWNWIDIFHVDWLFPSESHTTPNVGGIGMRLCAYAPLYITAGPMGKIPELERDERKPFTVAQPSTASRSTNWVQGFRTIIGIIIIITHICFVSCLPLSSSIVFVFVGRFRRGIETTNRPVGWFAPFARLFWMNSMCLCDSN